MMPVSEFVDMYSRKYGSGSVRSISKVIGSITFVSLTGPSAPLKSESLPSAMVSHEYLASSAVNGAPLLNLTFGRRWKTYVVGFGVSQVRREARHHAAVLPDTHQPVADQDAGVVRRDAAVLGRIEGARITDDVDHGRAAALWRGSRRSRRGRRFRRARGRRTPTGWPRLTRPAPTPRQPLHSPPPSSRVRWSGADVAGAGGGGRRDGAEVGAVVGAGVAAVEQAAATNATTENRASDRKPLRSGRDVTWHLLEVRCAMAGWRMTSVRLLPSATARSGLPFLR
jgi:hypothetical protein